MTTEERMTEVEQRCKSNTHRIDELAGDVKVLADLTASVKVLATKQENVEAVVREIKTDVKALTEAPARNRCAATRSTRSTYSLRVGENTV